MPQTRLTSYYRKRKNVSQSSRVKRRRVVPRRKLISGIHHFKRTAAPTAITGSGTPAAPVVFYGAFGYTFNQLNNVSEFINLFDHFRINAVTSRFYLQIDPSATSTQTNAIIPRMYWVRDYNDSAAPASVDQLREYSNCR